MNIEGKLSVKPVSLTVKSNKKANGEMLQLDVDLTVDRPTAEKIFGGEFGVDVFQGLKQREVSGKTGDATEWSFPFRVMSPPRWMVKIPIHLMNIPKLKVKLDVQPKVLQIRAVEDSMNVNVRIRLPFANENGVGGTLCGAMKQTVMEMELNPKQLDVEEEAAKQQSLEVEGG